MKGWAGVEQRTITTADEAAHPWIFRCPKPNCFYAVSAVDEEAARTQESNHQCPYQGGITKIAGSVTVTLVEDMWHKADAAFAAMSEEGITTDEANRRKGVVRGMCEMIAVFMPPHFHTGNEIGRELVKRAAAGDDYETPGLYGRRFEMPSPARDYAPPVVVKVGDRVMQLSTTHQGTVNNIDENGIQVKYDKGGYGTVASIADLRHIKAATLSAAVLKLTEQEIAAIKFASSSGAFSDLDIAKTYKISVSEVKQVVGS